MKIFKKIATAITFIGGAIFGLSFAQRKGSDFRSRLYKSMKKGEGFDVLAEEFSSIGKDVWQTALGVKDSKEVQKIISESHNRLKELGDDAKKYGGDVANVMGMKYEEISDQLSKQARELQKAAGKKLKKAVRKTKKRTTKKK